MAKENKGKVKIIGGHWRGRWLEFAGVADLRPTPNRVRETLFNWLGQTLVGYKCLDLFAGSGALGFEALSRGASQVVFVENFRPSVNYLKDNATKLGAHNATIVSADSWQWLSSIVEVYDIIFLDPPFTKTDYASLLELVVTKLAPGGLVYCESPRGLGVSEKWLVVKQDQAGQVQYQLLRAI
ncbi:MAG: 16S rRNA (guanine(966)-N(2))-methyltransferase RsmD [Ferrovum sp. 37-45-19]|uniref:16S rRNA (guanine(966)-N(2))-methyltransferase RsmD n=1 Tax=Ferrovum sp. JA12 TaxID=1356299 RepID=UPI0007025A03|nr:16S rRNA (guanine(966)-N(2))-methyltransferase RsmD [Ferrovum sp. JA12]OYV80550.1 MAG: 16S rRNA (guanine(966)-N(2))-methyltransferase RsmD [Ferrovum sp. 21-44-67]OYV94865.1 MAG: 16S rRNA (guanine(966)-N(2))-methyltransferase RsmD [Ferrovum sp. 37-45-19]OZB34102.1 MAG: 16S rRNA (guanine(966)-N(2))-methyltransferase RsmD [Ferrovum sp. 34-44-207]HQT81002.1 16S rRNA (guanine(966)-N(2))-methyltransferase RsmD [Ferrovaceae bacterium]KRH79273.1 ribosomal RNA small subunit methyltransferase D [Ferr